MKPVHIAINLAIMIGITFYRERYGQHIRATPTSTSVDSRMINIHRYLSAFQILSFLGVVLDPYNMDKIDKSILNLKVIIAMISAFGVQASMEFILMIASQFLVKYDEKANEALSKHEANKILKESLDACGADLIQARKDNSNLQNRIIILKDEIENESGRNRLLENIIDTKNRDIYRLYNRLDEVKDEKKEIVRKLLESIENNSKHIPEGDYIVIMDLLKQLYE